MRRRALLPGEFEAPRGAGAHGADSERVHHIQKPCAVIQVCIDQLLALPLKG